jgi:hypothetical protein
MRRRKFRKEPLSLEEVAFLLWATQGIREVIRPGVALRTVPSAARAMPLRRTCSR